MSPGGILEHCTSTVIRPRPTITLPSRGPFTFPAPYGTTGIRVTNPDDGPILPCGYSYWSNCNAHAGRDHLLVFLGVEGRGPCLWSVDKATLAVTPLGPIFPSEHPLIWSTGEGWYWSATDPAILYCSDDEHLYRLNVVTRALDPVADITPFRWMSRFALRQWHSSHDGLVHSATVKAITDEGPWPAIGTIVYREALRQPWTYLPKRGELDEGQVDPSGAWVLIKETLPPEETPGLLRPRHDEDNRIIRLADQRERLLLDEHGAAGHSDCGYGYMIAADNFYPGRAEPAAWRLWMFDEALEPQGRVVHYAHAWETQVNHVAHGNARPGPPDGQWVIGSGATRAIGPRAGEIVAFPLDGSLRVVVIAPTMVELDASGGGDTYGKYPKANVDPAGEFVLWTSNHGTDRVDAFLVRVPEWP